MTSCPPAPAGYEVLGRLARGSMAELWLAHPVDSPARRVVLKRALAHLADERVIADSLRSEGAWLAGLRSPHVVSLVEAREEPAGPLLVLEHLDGVTVAALLDAQARGGPGLGAGVVQRLGLDLLAGLTAVHEAGLLHGDVTPTNVVAGLDGTASVIDLGLASRVGEPAPDVWQGTAAYTAPERWSPGRRWPPAEVFAAGVVLWEALRGERLFRGGSALAIRQGILDRDAPPVDRGRPDLAPWAGVLAGALARDPLRRPPSVPELRRRWETASPADPRAAVGALVAAIRAWRRKPG